MDKFGIFKLLNSFFNFYEQNKNSSSLSNQTLPDLSSLFFPKNQGENKENFGDKTIPNENKLNNDAPPLQAQMLSTMHSHEQFVKRVKENNSSLTH